MWLWTRQEAKQIDELSIESGIPAETLMETAGQNSAALILKHLETGARKAIVLCGPGHNGGDGFVVARELLAAGIDATVIESSSSDGSDIRAKKKSEYKGHLVPIDQFLRNPIGADLWIDALFGIGLSRSIQGANSQLIAQVNSDFKNSSSWQREIRYGSSRSRLLASRRRNEKSARFAAAIL
jgi:hydroxyethylthiazole kinase-like uncharacterized protein yjeF